jgi:hypothetical protein
VRLYKSLEPFVSHQCGVNDAAPWFNRVHMETHAKKLLMVAALSSCGVAFAADSGAVSARAESEALLARLQSNGCSFNRNGSWHGSTEAREHLARKLELLDKNERLQSTEQFIERAASRSSVSGNAYQVKCAGEPPVDSRSWLLRQLAILRSTGKR